MEIKIEEHLQTLSFEKAGSHFLGRSLQSLSPLSSSRKALEASSNIRWIFIPNIFQAEAQKPAQCQMGYYSQYFPVRN